MRVGGIARSAENIQTLAVAACHTFFMALPLWQPVFSLGHPYPTKLQQGGAIPKIERIVGRWLEACKTQAPLNHEIDHGQRHNESTLLVKNGSRQIGKELASSGLGTCAANPAPMEPFPLP